MSIDVLLWIAMAVYGVVMFALSPRAASFGEFFAAEDNDGRQISTGFLVGSVVISWLFAKSITNAANLGASFGLRSSVLTDAFQCAMAMFLLVFALALVVPDAGAQEMLASGEWTLVGGVDLLLVGLLQSLSYGFHDPVLTDRSFISSPRSMLKG
jgi:hypothetical protein